MIRFECPVCGKGIKVDDSLAGKRAKCPACKFPFEIPLTSELPEEPPAKKPTAPRPRPPVPEPEAPEDLEVPAAMPAPEPPEESEIPVATAIPVASVAPPSGDFLDSLLDSPPPFPAGPPRTAAAGPMHPPAAMHYGPEAMISPQAGKPAGGALSLGIASLIVGSLSLFGLIFMCCLPVFGVFISPALGILGIVLGGVGIAIGRGRKGSGIGFSIAGVAVSSIGLVVGIGIIIFALAFTGGLDRALARAKAQSHLPPDSRMVPPSPEPSIPPPVKQPAKPTFPWTDASKKGAQLGNIRMSVVRVAAGFVPVRSGTTAERARSRDRLLSIWVQIQNTGERKVHYRGWTAEPGVSLVDDAGREYRRRSLAPGMGVQDATPRGNVESLGAITDALLFDLPEQVRYLRLTLPGDTVGERGEFHFEIPRGMIQEER